MSREPLEAQYVRLAEQGSLFTPTIMAHLLSVAEGVQPQYLSIHSAESVYCRISIIIN